MPVKELLAEATVGRRDAPLLEASLPYLEALSFASRVQVQMQVLEKVSKLPCLAPQYFKLCRY